ncbi:hypothetical protein EDB84DRAFT_1280411, partial [Lactarius hengduanensis]
VIPLIDRFTEKFEQMIMNEALHASLRHAAKTGLQVLNKYYSYTDHCDVYRLSILLHPRFKTYYFTHHKWPQGWIDEALDLLRAVWSDYKPAPVHEPPRPEPIPAPVATGSRVKKSRVDFNIVINYGHRVGQGSDALDDYLDAPPLPQEMDPIGYWLKQRKAGEAIGNEPTVALAQMALDYLSVPCLLFII